MASSILVLGSTGFVGGFIAKNLSEQYCVYSPSRQELDLADYQSVLSYFSNTTFDAVVNCACVVDSNLTQFNSAAMAANLLIFSNLYAVRHSYAKLINIGSGAEFDRNTNIDEAIEEMIGSTVPSDHYGLSKNIISRLILATENCYTLRLFGVFGSAESSSRLLKKVISGSDVLVDDRYFDYFYINDLIPVLEHYIQHTPKHKDINVVYPTKITLSYFLKQFCELHDRSGNNIKLSGRNGLNYTGNANKLSELQLPIIGLTQGLKDYI